MTRRTEFYITSIIGIALLVGTIGALLVDAADARPRDATDPAGDLPCQLRSAQNRSQLEPKERCDGFDPDEVGGVDRAQKLDECACVYAQAVCDLPGGPPVCAVPDARYACQENEQERRNACLQSLCVAVTCPPDPRELPLGDDITTATRVCDVCEMYGYTRGGEVQAQGLRFGPKAMLAAYSAFLFVDFAMAATAASDQLPQDLPQQPVLLPEIVDQGVGDTWPTEAPVTNYEYQSPTEDEAPVTTNYQYQSPPSPMSPTSPPSPAPPPQLCDVDELMDALPSALPSLIPCLTGATASCCQNVVDIVGPSDEADMTNCLCNRDAFDVLDSLLEDNVGIDLVDRLGDCAAKGYVINYPEAEGGGGGCDAYKARAAYRPRERNNQPRAMATGGDSSEGRVRGSAGPRRDRVSEALVRDVQA